MPGPRVLGRDVGSAGRVDGEGEGQGPPCTEWRGPKGNPLTHKADGGPCLSGGESGAVLVSVLSPLDP